MSDPAPSEGKPPPKPADWRSGFREAGPYLGLGMQMALTMVFFVGGGYGLDVWLGTLPWLTVAGSVLGMVAVFIHLFRVSAQLGKEDRARRRKQA